MKSLCFEWVIIWEIDEYFGKDNAFVMEIILWDKGEDNDLKGIGMDRSDVLEIGQVDGRESI